MNRKTGYAFLLSALVVGCGSHPKPAPKKPSAPVEQPPEELPEVSKPGMVLFRASKASLRGEILPKFEEQAGVRITWTGSERLVSIRMIHPMEWREALELVCQFTRTHVTTDYQGRLVLKDGYGGTLTSDNALLEEERRRQNRSLRKSSGVPTGSSGGSSTPSKPYRETVENTRGSGGSTNEGVEYNKGRKPNSVFDSMGGVTHH